MPTATIPQVNYVTDNAGKPVFVQIPIQRLFEFTILDLRLTIFASIRGTLRHETASGQARMLRQIGNRQS